MFPQFANNIYSSIAKLPFDTLVWIVWGTYFAIFVAVLLVTLLLPKKRTASKRPFLCLTNAYAAVNLSLYLLKCELAQSILISALFWAIGYILYGALCALSRPPKKAEPVPAATVIASLPAAATQASPAPAKAQKPESAAVKNNVRLEHAVSVTNKLLAKNLGKTDRQELEKLKNTFAVLQIKGTLSPTESEILNDNFNTLLKLMAKYNV